MSIGSHNRWAMLGLLFAVRATMAFQFQSVAAVAPLLQDELHIDIANIGFLIGMYFAPGVALAFLGGKIGQRFGDKRTALAGLALMLLGGLLMASSADWNAQIAGRLIAGGGGVILHEQRQPVRLAEKIRQVNFAPARADLTRKAKFALPAAEKIRRRYSKTDQPR